MRGAYRLTTQHTALYLGEGAPQRLSAPGPPRPRFGDEETRSFSSGTELSAKTVTSLYSEGPQ